MFNEILKSVDKFINGEITIPVISQVCSPDTGC